MKYEFRQIAGWRPGRCLGWAVSNSQTTKTNVLSYKILTFLILITVQTGRKHILGIGLGAKGKNS